MKKAKKVVKKIGEICQVEIFFGGLFLAFALFCLFIGDAFAAGISFTAVLLIAVLTVWRFELIAGNKTISNSVKATAKTARVLIFGKSKKRKDKTPKHKAKKKK